MVQAVLGHYQTTVFRDHTIFGGLLGIPVMDILFLCLIL